MTKSFAFWLVYLRHGLSPLPLPSLNGMQILLQACLSENRFEELYQECTSDGCFDEIVQPILLSSHNLYIDYYLALAELSETAP